MPNQRSGDKSQKPLPECDRQAEVSVEPISIEQAQRRLVDEIAKHLQTEDQVIGFLLDLRPIPGAWELVEMARHIGEDVEGFWRLGVFEWLARDKGAERLAELHRVFRRRIDPLHSDTEEVAT